MADADSHKISNCNIHYFLHPFEHFLKKQQSLGIESIELYASTPHLWIDHLGFEDPGPLKALLKRYGIQAIAFTPKPYNYSLCSAEGSRQNRATLAYYRNCMKVMGELGISLMCIDATGGTFDTSYEQLWKNCKFSLAQICSDARDRGITVAMGTARKGMSKVAATLEELKIMHDDMRDGGLKVVLDTCNMSRSGETIEMWFEAFGDQIAHLHFADGRSDGDRIWGDGCFPMGRYLDSLYANGYKGHVGLYLGNSAYHTCPEESDERNIQAIRGHFEQGGDRSGVH